MKLTFKKTKVPRMDQNGQPMPAIQGEVCVELPFGIFKDDDWEYAGKYNITHIPTGWILKLFRRKTDAKRFLELLADENLNWSFKKPPSTRTKIAKGFFAFMAKHYPDQKGPVL